MLSDKEIAKVKRQAEGWFQSSDKGLIEASAQLADAGWTWEQMRPLLTNVFNAGWGERDGEGCDHD